MIVFKTVDFIKNIKYKKVFHKENFATYQGVEYIFRGSRDLKLIKRFKFLIAALEVVVKVYQKCQGCRKLKFFAKHCFTVTEE